MEPPMEPPDGLFVQLVTIIINDNDVHSLLQKDAEDGVPRKEKTRTW